jgi:hypothetical protein
MRAGNKSDLDALKSFFHGLNLWGNMFGTVSFDFGSVTAVLYEGVLRGAWCVFRKRKTGNVNLLLGANRGDRGWVEDQPQPVIASENVERFQRVF